MTNSACNTLNFTIWPPVIVDNFIQLINLYPDMQLERDLFIGLSALPLENVGQENKRTFFTWNLKLQKKDRR